VIRSYHPHLVLIASVLAVALAGCGTPESPQPTPIVPVPTQVPPTVASEETVVIMSTATPEPLVAPVAKVSIAAAFEAESVAIGETVDAVISLEGVEDLFGLEVHLAYDAGRLAVVDADAGQDGAQIAHGDLLEVEFVLVNRANLEQGIIDYAVAQKADAAGVGGDGIIARVTFEATASGPAELRIVAAILANSQGQAIPVDFASDAVAVEVE